MISKTAAHLLKLDNIQMENGLCATVGLPVWAGPGDTMATPAASALRLFEDGVEIGPAHALHDDIRTQGGGRFSHWGGMLFFSASDGSDPATNHRRYQVLTAPPGIDSAWMSTVQSVAAGGPLGGAERHTLLSRLVAMIAPDFILPDHGRRLERDADFKAAFHRVLPDVRNTMDRKYAVWQLALLVSHLPGDMAEVGCYTGATAWFMAARCAEGTQARTLHLFDSFAGLSKPEEKDGSYWAEGVLSATQDQVRANLVEFPFVTLYPGWIPERFHEVADRRFIMVHIDVDLYQPTRDSVAFFYDRLVPGGLLICDDYGFASCPGATAALDEVMADKPEPVINLPSGGALIIKR